MESKIVRAIGLKNSPIVLLWTDEKPDEGVGFKEGKVACVGPMLVAASKGRTVYIEQKALDCPGGKSSLGFGAMDNSNEFPGGPEYFVSTGYKELYKTEDGRKLAEAMPALAEGEGYYKSPEVAKIIIQTLPKLDVSTKYVVFKPLENLIAEETPKVVVFLVSADQLSALLVLANYEGEHNLNVIAPMGAGCSTIGNIPYLEDESENPRAVLGLFDISIRRHFDKNTLSFSIPYKLFKKMEGNVEGSFLEKKDWLEILARN